jgi:hypothetical protein
MLELRKTRSKDVRRGEKLTGLPYEAFGVVGQLPGLIIRQPKR